MPHAHRHTLRTCGRAVSRAWQGVRGGADVAAPWSAEHFDATLSRAASEVWCSNALTLVLARTLILTLIPEPPS
jgi:hypothetical protein